MKGYFSNYGFIFSENNPVPVEHKGQVDIRLLIHSTRLEKRREMDVTFLKGSCHRNVIIAIRLRLQKVGSWNVR